MAHKRAARPVTAFAPLERCWPLKYYVIFNPQSGTALKSGLTAGRLEDAFSASGMEALVDCQEGSLDERIERALQADPDIIVCAGGDGTATAIVQRIVGKGKPLALIPLGTANLLARDLSIPLSVDEAIGQLRNMVPIEIDVADVNGRIFLHSVTVGLIPAIAAARERVRGASVGAFLGFARYMIRRLNNARRTAVAIASRDTEDRIERVHAIVVANNAYDQGWGKVFTRSCLSAGVLSLYVLRRLRASDVLRLGAKMVVGSWQDDEALTAESVRSVTLRSKRTRLSVMIDGETATLDTPLNFSVRPRALQIVAPAPSAKPSEEIRLEDRPSVGSALRPA